VSAVGHLTDFDGGAEFDKPLRATEVFGVLDLGPLTRTVAVFRVWPLAGEFEPLFWRFADFFGSLSVFILLGFCLDGLISILAFLAAGFDDFLSFTFF
jgi:hypothetical protein